MDQYNLILYNIVDIHLYQLIAEVQIRKDSLQNKDVYNVDKLESAPENHSHKGHILPLRYIHNIITQVYLDISLKKILSFFRFLPRDSLLCIGLFQLSPLEPKHFSLESNNHLSSLPKSMAP